MHTDHSKKRRTLLLLVLLLSTIVLFDALMIFNRQEPQTYQSSAATTQETFSPIGQSAGTSGYLIDELFDVSDEDHAVILDEFIKVLAQNEKDLNKVGSELGNMLGTDDYAGAYQALKNLQKGLGDAHINFSAAARLLDYHLEATSSASQTSVTDNTNNQVLGTSTVLNTVTGLQQQKKSIEEGVIKQLTQLKTAIQTDRQSLYDEIGKINALNTAQDLSASKAFCDGKAVFLTNLDNRKKTLDESLKKARTTQETAIKALSDLNQAIAGITEKTNAISNGNIENEEKKLLLKDRVILSKLKVEIENLLQSSKNDLVINNIVLEQNDSTIITTIKTLVKFFCQGLEENQVRQELNQLSNDLISITNEAHLLKESVQTIVAAIEDIRVQIPIFNATDTKETINFKFNLISILLREADQVTSKKILPAQTTFQASKITLDATQTLFTTLKVKYSNIPHLTADITRVESEITEVQALLNTIRSDLQSLSTNLQGLIDALIQLSQQLRALFAGISEELKKPLGSVPSEPGGTSQGQSTNQNDYCVQYDAGKNDRDLFLYDVTCPVTPNSTALVNRACIIQPKSSGSQMPQGRKCVRVGYIRVARQLFGLPFSVDIKGFRVGLSRRDGSVCACKANAPKLTSLRDYLGAYTGDVALGAVAIQFLYGIAQSSGGGDSQGGMNISGK